MVNLRRVLLPIAVPTLLVTVLAGPASAREGTTLARATGASPFPAGCPTPDVDPAGINDINAEVEPRFALDHEDGEHAIAVWQQDRWNDGGANGLLTGVSGDGGRTWARTFAHFTRCSGGTSTNHGDYDRASDPWVTIGPDGTAYQIALSFDATPTSARQAVLASRSRDGGRTWSEPATIAFDDSFNAGLDKESITADPRRRGFVYAVWDRLFVDAAGIFSGPTWFSRSTDGGRTWEAPRIIFDPGPNFSTIGGRVVVEPNGDLVTMLASFTTTSDVVVLRSTDKGVTWSGPFEVGTLGTVSVVNPNIPTEDVRTGDIVPDIAVDRRSGRLYTVWQDARFSGGDHDGIAISHSDDGGRTWSPATQVNAVPKVPAFTATIDVDDHGTVGVTYYDFRNDAGNPATLLTDTWLATSRNGGASWSEQRLGDSFDMRSAPNAGGWFVGDYEGLDHNEEGFVPFFVRANNGNVANRTDAFAARVGESDHGDSGDHRDMSGKSRPRSTEDRLAEHRNR